MVIPSISRFDHSGKIFDVVPCVDDAAPTHINELEAHRDKIEQEILLIAEPFSSAWDLLYTFLGFNINPMTAIALLSEVNPDISIFPSSKNLIS